LLADYGVAGVEYGEIGEKMTKLIILSLASLLCLPVASYAASIGGAETQGQGKLAIGKDGELVFSRDLKYHKSDWIGPGRELKNIEIDKMYRTMSKISYGVIDKLDIYVRLGAANFDAEAKQYRNGTYNGKIDTDGKYAFAYGFGLKGMHNFEDGWLVGLDLQFLSHKNRYKWNWAGKDDYKESGSGKMTVYEWHVAPYVAKKIGNLTPYVGGKYSDLRIKEKHSEGSSPGWTKIKANDNFGLFAGLDINMMKHLMLNVEGRFIDETAMSLNVSYRF
jgi:opacity protein-like surface antigen